MVLCHISTGLHCKRLVENDIIELAMSDHRIDSVASIEIISDTKTIQIRVKDCNYISKEV